MKLISKFLTVGFAGALCLSVVAGCSDDSSQSTDTTTTAAVESDERDAPGNEDYDLLTIVGDWKTQDSDYDATLVVSDDSTFTVTAQGEAGQALFSSETKGEVGYSEIVDGQCVFTLTVEGGPYGTFSTAAEYDQNSADDRVGEMNVMAADGIETVEFIYQK